MLDELIDWQAGCLDPIFQLTFPHPGMLSTSEIQECLRLVDDGAPAKIRQGVAQRIRARLNPHQASQLALNVPQLADRSLPGRQEFFFEQEMREIQDQAEESGCLAAN